jgi:hypothetical protein
VEIQIHAFLTSTLDGGKWSASCPGCFTSSTQWIKDWGVHQSRSRRGDEGKNIFPAPAWIQEPGHRSRSLVTMLTELQRVSVYRDCVTYQRSPTQFMYLYGTLSNSLKSHDVGEVIIRLQDSNATKADRSRSRRILGNCFVHGPSLSHL